MRDPGCSCCCKCSGVWWLMLLADTVWDAVIELVEVAEIDVDGDCGGCAVPVADIGGVFVLVRSILSADPLIALEMRFDWS